MASCSLTDAGICCCCCWSSQGCWGPDNKQISYFERIYASFLFLEPNTPEDVFFSFFPFFFSRMSLSLRMRSGLLLFLFAQVILVSSLTQTGRCLDCLYEYMWLDNRQPGSTLIHFASFCTIVASHLLSPRLSPARARSAGGGVQLRACESCFRWKALGILDYCGNISNHKYAKSLLWDYKLHKRSPCEDFLVRI